MKVQIFVTVLFKNVLILYKFYYNMRIFNNFIQSVGENITCNRKLALIL